MRLIDADALEFEPDQHNAFAMNGVAFAGRFGGKTAAMVQNALKHMIDNATTVDAVPVVRCKECKHSKIYPAVDRRFYLHCNMWDEITSSNGYCYHGAKMDGKEG
jgi:hypothetical protein